MGYPGTTLDKVVQDAQTFAKWKVDMLKLDGCFSTPEEQAKGESHSCLAAIRETGRDGHGRPTGAHLAELICLYGPWNVVFPNFSHQELGDLGSQAPKRWVGTMLHLRSVCSFGHRGKHLC